MRRRSRWTPGEVSRFFEALEKYGKDYTQIQKHVATRDLGLCHTFASNKIKQFREDPSRPYAEFLPMLEIDLKRGRKLSHAASFSADSWNPNEEVTKVQPRASTFNYTECSVNEELINTNQTEKVDVLER